MEAIIVQKENPLVIQVSGRIDALNAGSFEENVMGFIGNSHCNILIDVSGLDYISSAGIRVFLLMLVEVNKSERKIGVVAPGEMVKEVFEISGLENYIAQFNSVVEGVEAMKK